MFKWQRNHFIDELVRKGYTIDILNPLSFENPESANVAVLNQLKEKTYNLFISSTGYYKMISVDTLKEIRRIGVPSVTIAWDNLAVPYYDKDTAPYFDLIWLTAKETTPLYEKWGAKTIFLPYAANPYIYTYTTSNLNRHITFIGNPHGSRTNTINTLTQNSVLVDIYSGKNPIDEVHQPLNHKYNPLTPSSYYTMMCRFMFPEGRTLLKGSFINKIKGGTKLKENEYLYRYYSLPLEKMIETYNSSTLCLAFSAAGHTGVLQKPLNLINLRNFEIPMCGGVELCRYSEELSNYFEEDKEIIFYNSEEELVDKSLFYLNKASDKVLYDIKMRARKRSENEHTWIKRFEILFKELGL